MLHPNARHYCRIPFTSFQQGAIAASSLPFNTLQQHSATSPRTRLYSQNTPNRQVCWQQPSLCYPLCEQSLRQRGILHLAHTGADCFDKIDKMGFKGGPLSTELNHKSIVTPFEGYNRVVRHHSSQSLRVGATAGAAVNNTTLVVSRGGKCWRLLWWIHALEPTNCMAMEYRSSLPESSNRCPPLKTCAWS